MIKNASDFKKKVKEAMQIVRKKRCITLIEIMIVMFLIALITGIIAYNYRGSLDEGKAFKTKMGIEKLKTVLNLKIAEDPKAIDDIENTWKEAVKKSPLVQNPNAVIHDGWGEEYDVNVDDKGNIQVTSAKYEEYIKAHSESLFKSEEK